MIERRTNDVPPGSGVPPAPGGTPREVVARLRALGDPAAISVDGTQAWLPFSSGVLVRLPLHCTSAVDPGSARRLLSIPRVRLLDHLSPHDAAHPPNATHYVCRVAGYDLSAVPSSGRKNVKRGLDRFEVRRCTDDEWERHGLAAFVDTDERHGYAVDPARNKFRDAVRRWRGQPFHEIWGAWRDGELEAWLTVFKVDDWAMTDLIRSRTRALRDRPNHVLLFHATRALLRDERRAYVSMGLSSLQVGVDEAGMHAYKLSMGYAAEPVRRTLVTRPAYRLLLRPRALSWAWDRAARAAPRSATLRKVAGLSRLLSGRAAAAPGDATDDGAEP